MLAASHIHVNLSIHSYELYVDIDIDMNLHGWMGTQVGNIQYSGGMGLLADQSNRFNIFNPSIKEQWLVNNNVNRKDMNQKLCIPRATSFPRRVWRWRRRGHGSRFCLWQLPQRQALHQVNVERYNWRSCRTCYCAHRRVIPIRRLHSVNISTLIKCGNPPLEQSTLSSLSLNSHPSI